MPAVDLDVSNRLDLMLVKIGKTAKIFAGDMSQRSNSLYGIISSVTLTKSIFGAGPDETAQLAGEAAGVEVQSWHLHPQPQLQQLFQIHRVTCTQGG